MTKKAGEGVCPREDMKRGLNICCGVLALALLFGGCAQSVPQQEQEPKAEPVAAEAFAAEVEPAGKRLCGRFPGGVVLWGGLRGGSFF